MIYFDFYKNYIFNTISRHEMLLIEHIGISKPDMPLFSKMHDELPSELKIYYENNNGFYVKWMHPVKEEVFGGMNIMGLEHLFDETVLEIQPELVVVNDDLNFSKKKNLVGVFRKVDLFTPEASVGFFSDEQMGNELYYCTRHYFYLLNLNFEQYFQLMCEAKGFTYWQLVIINLEYGYGQVESDWFQEQMPKLFPSFNFDTFIALYQQFKNEFLLAKEKNAQ